MFPKTYDEHGVVPHILVIVILILFKKANKIGRNSYKKMRHKIKIFQSFLFEKHNLKTEYLKNKRTLLLKTLIEPYEITKISSN